MSWCEKYPASAVKTIARKCVLFPNTINNSCNQTLLIVLPVSWTNEAIRVWMSVLATKKMLFDVYAMLVQSTWDLGECPFSGSTTENLYVEHTSWGVTVLPIMFQNRYGYTSYVWYQDKHLDDAELGYYLEHNHLPWMKTLLPSLFSTKA